MFIESLKIHNWRSHKVTELRFGALNLIRGANASGKTSIAQAIEFLLTGRCLGTDEAGRGGDALIRDGAREAVVEGQLSRCASEKAVNSRLSLTRRRNAAGSTCAMQCGNGRVYAGRQVEDFLQKWSWSKAGLSCVLRAGRFLELMATEQKELLASVLEPEPLTTPPEILEAMRTCLSGAEIEIVDLNALRELEDGAVKLRAECTAALREMGDPEAPAESKSKGNSTQIKRKLDELRSEQMRLRVEKERTEGKWAEASRRWRELPGLIAQAKSAILDSETEQKYMEAVDHEPKRREAEEALAGVLALISEYQRQLTGISKEVGKCPTCGQETDTDELRDRTEKLLKAAQKRVPTLEGIRDKYKISAPEARQALANHRSAVITLGKLEAEQKATGEPKLDAEKIQNLEAQITQLEERIKKGQERLTEVAADDERRRAYEEAVAKRSEIEKRREAADILAKWAGPNGAQAQMTAGKLPAFIKQINEVLEAFGYACDIEMEPYRILARRRMDGSANLQLRALSESEQWRFSLGFQAALAKATGVNAIVLDRADVLVGENRGKLLKAIMGLGLDQIFLLASVDKFAPMPPAFTVFDLSLNGSGETVVTKGA